MGTDKLKSQLQVDQDHFDNIFRNTKKENPYYCMDCQDKGYVARANNIGGISKEDCEHCKGDPELEKAPIEEIKAQTMY